ncbi:hypothetical protein CK203_080717 [Vitis vinifera]|uniref:DUF4283 domain-containing protein n=1 Tax=Vitis vinifera TaxID=29760 RepID=A0A438DZH0_VITVI|nr:hypothetical protein CK203_080717 [Vitis vinifera]
MTQKSNLFKGQPKRKVIAPNRHGKPCQTRKGKRVVKPSKVTKEMDADRIGSALIELVGFVFHKLLRGLIERNSLVDEASLVNGGLSCLRGTRVGGEETWGRMVAMDPSSVYLRGLLMILMSEHSSKGSRQGDPLSPYLCVIAMEVLSSLLMRAWEGGFLSGFKDHATNLCWLLVWFESILGLKINLQKRQCGMGLRGGFEKGFHVEWKGGISSWVRLGPVSLGIVFECLNLSIEDGRMGRWVREWKENGRMYSLSRDYNRGGCFLCLGVADLERKRFSVFIPKGRGVKGRWASMVDILRSLGCEESYPNNQKVDVSRSKPNMVKSYMEATKVTKEKGESNTKGDDLRGWGSQLARIWRLKGNLGLAKMERGKVLMEFEIPAEVEQASKMGSILLGGVALRLEKWSPKTGCLKEGERSNEAWVRVVGLPVSLWERDILRKIGEACGGLLAIDHQTEKMEELQWARLLVKWNGESPPSLVERGKAVVTVAKEGGDASARVGVRVLGAMEDSRLEDCLLTADGTQRQSSGSGQTSDPTWSEDGPPGGPHASGGLGFPPGLVFYGNGNGKPKEKVGPLSLLKGDGPAFQSPSPLGSSKAQTEKGSSAVERIRSPLRGPDMDISTCWGKDDQWGLRRGDETQWGGISRTDSALLEEDARYDNVPSSSGMVALDPSPPFFSSFGRTPRKESFDRSGLIVESTKGDCLCKEIGHSEQFVGKCWDLVEISNDSMEDDRKALCLARPISQEEGAWVEERWEESDLVRFSQFLGFSTEGLEKDILEFMVKIRKRRERIHSKAMLEKSKFERELRRLECSVNYEGGKKRKGTVQGRGCQIMEV